MNKKPFSDVLAGLLAGTLATVPMTGIMEFLHRWPYPERDSLPPEQITSIVAARFGLKKRTDRRQLAALTIAQHFAFGAAMGSLYALTTSRLKGHPILKGAV
jgi:hypothetical protein